MLWDRPTAKQQEPSPCLAFSCQVIYLFHIGVKVEVQYFDPDPKRTHGDGTDPNTPEDS